jgi:phage terminase large subunit
MTYASSTIDVEPRLRFSSFYQANPKQWQFHTSTAKYRAQVGGFGGGKTRAGLMEAIRYAMSIPGCQCLIIRRTYKDLQKTIVNLLLNPLPTGIGVKLEDLGAYFNKNDMVCYFDHAEGVQSKIFFGYCDQGKDVDQYLSTEYVFIFIEEAGEFPFVVWKELTGRNRCPVKVDLFGNAVRPTVALATNPIGVGYGWIKALFVDKRPTGGMSNYDPTQYELIHSTLWDNPVYASDAEYIAALEALPERERRKKLYGDLHMVTGQYFTNFVDNPKTLASNVCPYNAVDFKHWHPRWIGIDWGFAHGCGITFFCKADVKRAGGVKTVNVVYDQLLLHPKDESLTEAMIAFKIKERLKPGDQIANIFLSHEAYGHKDSRRSTAEQLGDELIKLTLPRPVRADADKNARTSGWKLAYNQFEQDQLVITENCTDLIRAIPLLIHDPDNLEDILKTETDEDDVADGFRYGLKGFLEPGSKPLEDELEEKLREARDNTQRFMIQQQFEEQHRGQGGMAIQVPKRKLR